jgi:anti-anti-sigma factor
MQIVQTELASAQLLTLSGRLDTEAAPEFERRCTRLVESQTRNLIVNVSALDYLSSAGLRIMLVTGKALRSQNGKLVLVAAAGPVRHMVELAGFDKIFPIYTTVTEATQVVNTPP